jgi:RNA polymerase sigma-70 factor (ECF subfamily)
MRELANGDRLAFLALYKNFFIALCIFARGFVADHQRAEDIVQEVFCRLYDHNRPFENITSLRSYLYEAVRNGCLNSLRDEKRRRKREHKFIEELSDDNIFFDHIIESEVGRQLQNLLLELPPQCRAVFERTLEGSTSEQIARAMGLSVETVKTQRKKAKRLLREKYALLFDVFGILF